MPNPTNFNIYKWSDIDAPVINYDGPSVDTGSQIANLLDKVLVTGYGSKTPAGWTKPYQNGLYHVYQMGANSSGRFLQVYASPPEDNKTSGKYYTVKTDVFDSMTSATAGTGSIYNQPYNYQVGWGFGDTAASGARSHKNPWYIVANSSIFYFFKFKSSLSDNSINCVGVGDIISNTVKKQTILINDVWYNATYREVEENQDLNLILQSWYDYGACYLTGVFGSRGVLSGGPTSNYWQKDRRSKVSLASINHFVGKNEAGSNGPFIVDGPLNTKYLEKISVIGSNNGGTWYGYLPGIYRAKVSKSYPNLFELANYMVITSTSPNYTNSKQAIFVDSTGDWYV